MVYHRGIAEDETKHTTALVAERIRKLLARAVILMVILMGAPYLYGMLTGGRLDHLAGANAAAWETIQRAPMVMTAFLVLGLMGVARCTRDTS